MTNPLECPECGEATNTECVEKRTPTASVRIEVYACNECYAGWQASWSDPDVTLTQESIKDEVDA